MFSDISDDELLSATQLIESTEDLCACDVSVHGKRWLVVGWLCTLTAETRSTQPSTLRGTVK